MTGAAVDSRAYFPIAFEIAARGWLVVIVQQTARSSPLFPDDASTVLDSNDTAFAHVSKSKWAIGGHSAGGSGASIFALANPDKVIALLFHSSRLTANASSTGLPVVNVIGTIDGVAALGGPPKYGPVVTTSIEGGNHYQIGDYGYQYPDNVAVISQEEQQSEFAKATVDFLNGLPARTRI